MKCAFLLLLFFLLGCSSEEARLSSISGINNGGSGESVSFTVANLGVSPLVLTLNDESQFLVTTDGTYTFSQKVRPSSEFEVSVGSDPADRNCVVVDPVQFSTGSSHVTVKCAPDTLHYYSGNVSGLSDSGLVVRLTPPSGTPMLMNIPANAKKWTSDLPVPGTASSITIQSQPNDLECYFVNSGITNATVPVGIYNDFHIDCKPNSAPTYTLQVQITGLSGSIDIGGKNTYQTYSSNGTSIFGVLNQNTRQVLEILTAPPGQRCYFNQTKNHLYSEYITSAFDHLVQVTCVPRATCESSGVELPSVNGTLNDLECVNDKFIFGGKFKSLGRQMGFLRVQGGASTPIPDFKTWDRVHGKVHDIVGDGRKGIYVAGDFQKVGDLFRRNIVHMNIDKTVNEAFDVETNGPVYKIISTENKVYLFGDFTQVIQNGTIYPRDGFAKIDHSTLRPTVTNLTLPPGIKVSPRIGFSASVFGSMIYAHGSFIENGILKNLSVRINRHSGKMTSIQSTATELSRTLYWQEPATGKIWMLNSSVGIVDPLTLSIHPFNGSQNYVPLNHEYTLARNNLYSSDGSSVKVTNLNNLHNGSPPYIAPWGRDASATFADIRNVGHGFASSATQICFFQKIGTTEIIIGSDSASAANRKKGIACFSETGNLQVFNPANVIDATKAYVTDNNIFINPTHFIPQLTNALAIVNTNGTFFSYQSGMLENDEVKTLATENSNLYVGGNFNGIPGCTGCKHIAKMTMGSSLTVDPSWTFSIPFSAPVRKLSEQGGVLAGISEDPTRHLFGLDLVGAPDDLTHESFSKVPLDIFNIGDSMIVRHPDRVTFHEQVTLGTASPLTTLYGITPVSRTTNRLVTALTSGSLILRDLDGSEDNYILTSDFNPRTLELAFIGDRPCLYNGNTSVYCTDEGGVIKLSKTIPDEDFTKFRSVRNAAVLLKGRSAPVLLVPDP